MWGVRSGEWLSLLLLSQPLEPEREEKGSVQGACRVLGTQRFLVPPVLHPGHPSLLAVFKTLKTFSSTLHSCSAGCLGCSIWYPISPWAYGLG